MKRLQAVAMGVMLVATMIFASGSLAVAGPHGPGGPGKHHPGGGHPGGHPGGHHGHHRGHWGYGPGFIVSGSSYLVEDDCPTVKRCYINKFGEKRCRWVSACD